MDLKSLSPLVIVAAMAVVVLGLPIGLYALFTSDQRRTTREIRKAAAERGWKYRRRRWQGNPAAFRIDGRTESGLPWTLTSGTGTDYSRGWSVQLMLKFATLGGDTDLALLPRDGEIPGSPSIGAATPLEAASRVAAISGVLGSAVEFFRHAEELPSGHPEFDARYRILVSPQQFRQPLIDSALAERILQCPSDAIAPHSVLAWRQPFAFEVEARLLGPPNWSTVSWLISLANDLIARVPPVVKSVAPHGFVDRLIDRLL